VDRALRTLQVFGTQNGPQLRELSNPRGRLTRTAALSQDIVDTCQRYQAPVRATDRSLRKSSIAVCDCTTVDLPVQSAFR